ncbi:hypothetical protein [Rhodobacter sp. 24-YEA-8]|uniref:hypothetical protein n=1 Tax=Rhodobacter sp. 24-YEA-8 TaxID=1884310 RepID=UPI00089C28F0|nr:hypothetical protein [Rhodobacter sp. 24-YEA-8]SED87931.1 Acyl-CoA dehydrogenase [Rhodobacter sp. 24-YEA-8]
MTSQTFSAIIIELGLAPVLDELRAGAARRNHFALVETVLRLGPGSALARKVLPKVAAGEIFGWSLGETAGDPALGLTIHRGEGRRDSPRLRITAAGLRLDGVTHYSTGNLYADHLQVTASDEGNNVVQLVVPVTRAGVSIPDDWDGFGQRGTGSGTTEFVDVAIRPEDIIDRQPGAPPPPPYASSFTQLYLTTVVAGVATSALQEATAQVSARKSNYYHGLNDRPADEVEIQLVLGEISADVYGIREAVQTKVFVDRLSQAVIARIFEVLSGRGIRAEAALDSHWRNARAISVHNPAIYKARILGDHLVNGRALPAGLFF